MLLCVCVANLHWSPLIALNVIRSIGGCWVEGFYKGWLCRNRYCVHAGCEGGKCRGIEVLGCGIVGTGACSHSLGWYW